MSPCFSSVAADLRGSRRPRRARGEARERLQKVAVEAARREREKAVANPIARAGEVAIRRVGQKRKALAADIGGNLFGRSAEKRALEARGGSTRPRRIRPSQERQRTGEGHAATPWARRSEQDAQENRFRLIAEMMGGHHDAETASPRDRAQETIAGDASGFFEAEAMPPRQRGNVRGPRNERHAPSATEAARPARVGFGDPSAHTVVQMGRNGTMAGNAQQMEQGHRVTSPGESEEHALARSTPAERGGGGAEAFVQTSLCDKRRRPASRGSGAGSPPRARTSRFQPRRTPGSRRRDPRRKANAREARRVSPDGRGCRRGAGTRPPSVSGCR